MARKQHTQIEESPADLMMPKDKADAMIAQQLKKGRELRNTNIQTRDALKQAVQKYYSWEEYVYDMLTRMFSNNSVAKQFRSVTGFAKDLNTIELARGIQSFHDDMDFHIRRLDSVRERLELMATQPPTQPASSILTVSPRSTLKRNIFIVHGHDEAAKETVARFIEKLGLKAIILHEQPNIGRTIIEKFEDHSANVDFAIVLLTPDDFGASNKAPDDRKLRARQNVIFELGYFIGKLGRKCVCALYKKGVEIPTDMSGVLFVLMDSDSWKFELAKELKEAEFDIDMNKIL